MLKVCLLGTVQALIDEQPITGFVSNKVRALLAYLSVEVGRPHSREALASLLWPDRTQSSAQGNLRYALSNLRKLLRPAGAELLAVSRQSVQLLCTDQASIDVGVFQNLLKNGQDELLELERLETAIGLYRGEFLEGLTIGDSTAFEEWCAVRREQFHRQMLEALHHVAEIYVKRGEYDQAYQHAWRGLELEPWDEEGHRQLMRALTLNGHRDAALAQYAKCRQVLAQELDIEPSPETNRLFEDIHDGRVIRSERGMSGGKGIVTTNLPTPLTSFVGRQREIAEIERLLGFESDADARPSTRLLTLVGAGGCGKTRLAIESARRMSTTDHFPNGVWCVNLAQLSNPTLVTQAVATLFGLSRQRGISPIIALTEYLLNKKILLLLDNCEHLIEACAQLAEVLLQSCPGLQILATSREALDIEGERILEVNPLALPGPEHPPTSERLLDCDSIRLFVERAEAARPAFVLIDDNAPAVIRICRQLDGIPLAMELAARHLKALPVEQIAARLEHRFLLLTNGDRTALPHHRTLRAVFDWSYDYLSTEERSLFCQAAVFSGGWTLSAADQVSGGNALELVTGLVNKSLVIAEQSGAAERYYMLETIRQYGLEKLAEACQQESAHMRHLEFFLQLAESARRELRGENQKLWMQRVEVEQDNIRTALEWSLRSADGCEAGLRLAIAMCEFWNRRGYFREERQWLERALAVSSNACTPRLRAWATIRLAYCAFCLGDFETLEMCLDNSWGVFCDLEDQEGMALVMQGRATLAGEQKHDIAAARAYLEESLRLLEPLGDKWNLAQALKDLGRIHYLRGDLDEAKAFLHRSLRISRQISDTMQLGPTLLQLGFVALQEGDYHGARSFFEESRQLAKEHGDRDGTIDALSGLGELACCEQNYRQARAFYEEGLIAARELGTQQAVAYLQRGLGHVALHYGEHQQAMIYFGKALQYWQGQDMRHPIAGCLAGIAGVAAARDEMERAVQLVGKVAALITETSPFRSPSDQKEYEQTISLARAHLDEEQYRELLAKGFSMTLEQILQVGMSNLEH